MKHSETVANRIAVKKQLQFTTVPQLQFTTVPQLRSSAPVVAYFTERISMMNTAPTSTATTATGNNAA